MRAVGLQGAKVGKGDEANAEHRPAKVHFTRIAIVRANAPDARDRPEADNDLDGSRKQTLNARAQFDPTGVSVWSSASQ